MCTGWRRLIRRSRITGGSEGRVARIEKENKLHRSFAAENAAQDDKRLVELAAAS
jgi:hypothetical protein